MDANPLEQRVADLVARALDGDDDAVAALYALYHRRLVGIAHRRCGNSLHGLVESVDLVQSTWRDVLGALHQFEDRGPDSFFHWLHTCLIRKIRAKRRYYHAAKRDTSRAGAMPAEEAALPSRDRTPSQTAAFREEMAKLLRTIDRLPATQRDVLLLHMRDGLPHTEIARRIGKSHEATKKIYQRAMHRLLDILPADLDWLRRGSTER